MRVRFWLGIAVSVGAMLLISGVILGFILRALGMDIHWR
jgi:hypothetical protein